MSFERTQFNLHYMGRDTSSIVTGRKGKTWLCKSVDFVARNLGVSICLLFSLKYRQNHLQRSQNWKFKFPGRDLKEPLHRTREKAGRGECQAALTMASAYDSHRK